MDFNRGNSVKETLNLGLFVQREFGDDYDALDFISLNIKEILKGMEGGLNWEKIERYVAKYIRVDSGFPVPYPDYVADPSLMFLIREKYRESEIFKLKRP